MGAYFQVNRLPAGVPAEKAFHDIQQQALWDYGHTGYTGTIAEAAGFEVVKQPFATYEEARKYANDMAEKWGPALLVTVGDKRYFMGWYSS